jgi:metal-sulfur cluster biosynthetic enzyme
MVFHRRVGGTYFALITQALALAFATFLISPQASTGGAISADQARLILRRVKDPDLNINIVDLGLFYEVHVHGSNVQVDMSLTSPGCPSGPEIMGEAEVQLRTIPGIGDVTMNLVWSPPWTPERIEPRVRAYMGF